MLALLGALALNLALFGLLPTLLDHSSGKPQMGEAYRMDTFIRIKRPEKPIHKKDRVKKKIIPPESHKNPQIKRLVTPSQKLKTIRPLPFKLNTKLPANNIAGLQVPMSAIPITAGDINGIYGVGDIDSPLTVLVRVPPVYPLRAQRRGIEGLVKVRFVITEKGLVEDVRILEATPENIFEKSVLQCVASWRFKPGTVEGIPVKTVAESVVRFDLD